MNDRIDEAARCYIRRNSREEHPCGIIDRGRRWHPSESERQVCCSFIRPPSRSFPWSLMIHCRSAKHVAHLYDVPEKELKRRARIIEKLKSGELKPQLNLFKRYVN